MEKVNTVLISLSDLLASNASKSSVKRALKAFSCERDDDVTTFLQRYAIRNEESGASRSYLAADKSRLTAGELHIVAFFTLAITVTNYADVRGEKRLGIMGRVPGLNENDYFPGYLLAQLARDDHYDHNDFDCLDLLETAESIIFDAMKSVGGKIIYLDCKDGLVPYYEKQGYSELFVDAKTGLHKMLKCVSLLS